MRLLDGGRHLFDLSLGQAQHSLCAFGAELGVAQLFLHRIGDFMSAH
jgi:hypothetical protein